MEERVVKELRTQNNSKNPSLICFYGINAESALEELKEDEAAAKLVITIHLKKMEPSLGAGVKPNQLEPKNFAKSVDNINNNFNSNNPSNSKPSVSKSGVVEPYNGLYNLFKNSKTNTGDSNNNKGNSSSYPIVTPVNASLSVLESNGSAQSNIKNNNGDQNCSEIVNKSIEQNVAVNQELPVNIDLTRRYNPEEYTIEDCDERARIKRAKEIAEGVEIIQNSPKNISIQSQPLNFIDATQILQSNQTSLSEDANQQSQNPWFLCSTDLFHFRHLGVNGHTILPNIDGEIPVIHSQDYYMHCLVPDLQKITACCFYWGKMDRYEAEKLLDGKAEGTFLLRDSAQDDFLFSVSFRKYGRSLHARIEQFNHLFSFDSHDPSVFTAPTVTALLEHYKDPSCVMFFEPMLTIPLNRSFCFSLASLSRAAIVSNCTYDGLNELCLPPAMKSFLREYHYKQRVRVKRFDEHIYANS